MQVGGENYLIPVDFAGASATEVAIGALRARDLQRELSARARVSVVVLDACRNNPFGETRAWGDGLARMEARGSLTAFATEQGKTASDNAGGSNGLFTQHLVARLRQPGLTLSAVFRGVREDVLGASRGQQWPAVYDNLIGDEVVLRPLAGNAPAPVSAAGAGEAERALWEAATRADSVSAYDAYLKAYPSGDFAAAARLHQQRLRAAPRRRRLLRPARPLRRRRRPGACW